MKFLDLNAQYRTIKNEIDKEIKKVINSSSFILGKYVEKFEKEIAKYIGVKYAVGLNSGSDALTASLVALGIGKGDEVIVPCSTYISTVEAVCIVGAKPIFVDIDINTYNINPNLIEKAITEKTKAIIPVHLYGLSSDMKLIIRVAKKYKIKIIEDCAQAIGAKYFGKKVGSFGDIGCLSFFPTKNLGAYGDAGMIVTDNKKIADFIKKWRIHGQNKKYYTEFVGASSRLDGIQAAILSVKLKYLDKWNKKRNEIAQYYLENIKNDDIILPIIPKGYFHVFHQFTIRFKKHNRDLFQKKLEKKEIPSIVYYPLPLHQQKAYKFLNTKKHYINSELVSKSVLSLPIYPELNKKNQDEIINELNNI